VKKMIFFFSFLLFFYVTENLFSPLFSFFCKFQIFVIKLLFPQLYWFKK
jgi:hypothetical protein